MNAMRCHLLSSSRNFEIPSLACKTRLHLYAPYPFIPSPSVSVSPRNFNRQTIMSNLFQYNIAAQLRRETFRLAYERKARQWYLPNITQLAQ